MTPRKQAWFLGNPHLGCDVAWHDRSVIGFSVYTIDRAAVFRWTLLRRGWRVLLGIARAVMCRPSLLAAEVSNLRYVGSERLPQDVDASSQWLVAGVRAECRTAAFEAAAAGNVASALLAWRGRAQGVEMECYRALVLRSADS